MAAVIKRPAPSPDWVSATDSAISDALLYEWALWAVHHHSDGTLRECFRDRYRDDGTLKAAPGSAGKSDVDGA